MHRSRSEGSLVVVVPLSHLYHSLCSEELSESLELERCPCLGTEVLVVDFEVWLG